MKNNLRLMRQARQLTQEELALQVGVSRQTINAIETEKYVPSLPLALDLAQFFGLEVEQMFVKEEENQAGC
jgi:putative transcriptional regulator